MPDAHLIVANPSRDAVMLVDGALPVVDASRVLRAGALLGVRVVVVRTQERDGENRVVACEASELPRGGRWADEVRARDVPRYADVVGSWFDEEAGRVPVDRVPWLRHGWLAATIEWAGVHGPVTQLRHWGLSAVVRIGDVVVKQTLPVFAHEPAVMRWLESKNVPDVLRVDGDRWVMQAVDVLDYEDEPGALRTLARLQRRDTGSAPCPVRPLRRLADQVAALAARDDILFATDATLHRTDGRLPPREFTERDRRALHAALPELARRVERLAGLGIAETIVHGDFHINNVGWTGDRFVVFDWGNAAVAHPFMDLPMWLQWSRSPEASVRAYLREWGPDLEDAWRDAHPVALLHHALTLMPLAGDPQWAAGIQKRVLEALFLLGSTA